MPNIEEIREQFGLQREETQKQASAVSLQKEASNSVSKEINDYLESQTLPVFIAQIEKEAGAVVPDNVKSFIDTQIEAGRTEEEIINFIKEKMNA